MPHPDKLKAAIIAAWNDRYTTTKNLADLFGLPSKSAVAGILDRSRKKGIDVYMAYPKNTAFGYARGQQSASWGYWNGMTDAGLARKLGLTQAAVWYWRKSGVPPQRIESVIYATGMDLAQIPKRSKARPEWKPPQPS